MVALSVLGLWIWWLVTGMLKQKERFGRLVGLIALPVLGFAFGGSRRTWMLEAKRFGQLNAVAYYFAPFWHWWMRELVGVGAMVPIKFAGVSYLRFLAPLCYTFEYWAAFWGLSSVLFYVVHSGFGMASSHLDLSVLFYWVLLYFLYDHVAVGFNTPGIMYLQPT